MSSTRRSDVRNAHPFDYYVTPIKTVTDFVRALQEDTKIFTFIEEDFPGWKNPLILDPCAGGSLEDPVMPYPFAINTISSAEVRTMDIREDSCAELTEDFLAWEPLMVETPMLTIGNPPFNLAMEFIHKAFEVTQEGGYIAFLLRLSFFASKKRREFWKQHMPVHTYVHAERPSFTKGGNDSADYAHFVWRKGLWPRETKLRVI